MGINRNNYEAYLLDLLEGNLSADEEQMVRNFLLMNPDCAMDLEDSEPWTLEKVRLLFSNTMHLKKKFPDHTATLSEHNFDLFSIARLEGDLSPEQVKAHEAGVKNSEKKNLEWKIWEQTRLVAEHISYSNKSILKRKGGSQRRLMWLSALSAAAAIGILIAVLRTDSSLPAVEMAMEGSVQALAAEEQAAAEKPLDSGDQEFTGPEADEPVMFSIKKQADRPIESQAKKRPEKIDHTQDSLSKVQTQQLQARPIPLASLGSFKYAPVTEAEYDRIQALDLPPSEIHMRSMSLAQIAEIDLQKALLEYKEEKNISLWSIANAGINGINKVTGADISLLAAKDENGDLSGFRFKTKRFSVTSPIDQAD